jgi:signal transduction histidine kinase
MTRWLRSYGLVVLMVIVVTLMHYNTAMHIHAAHGIYRRLYYFPIIVAAFRGGRTAGLVTALSICAVYIPHAFGLIGHDPAPALEKVLEMVLYLAVGLVTGVLEDRQRRVQQRLEDALRERERLQRELVARERLAAVGQLSAGLAHEIRNPLASIKGAADVLGDAEPADGGRGRMLTIIREEAARLNDVLTRFLAFARPRPRDIQRVDLTSEVTRLGDLLAHRDPAPRVVVAPAQGPLVVTGDLDQIRQVLLNVGVNAAQAAGPAPTGIVTLQTSREGRMAQIAIIDTGPGFSDEALASVGTPFYSTRDGGTGLGLATSMRIARDHGGELSVDPDHASGARVCVRLPLASEDS